MVQPPASNCVIPYVFCSVYRTGNLSLLLSVFLIQPIMAQGGTSNIFLSGAKKKRVMGFFSRKICKNAAKRQKRTAASFLLWRRKRLPIEIQWAPQMLKFLLRISTAKKTLRLYISLLIELSKIQGENYFFFRCATWIAGFPFTTQTGF